MSLCSVLLRKISGSNFGGGGDHPWAAKLSRVWDRNRARSSSWPMCCMRLAGEVKWTVDRTGDLVVDPPAAPSKLLDPL